MSKASAAIPKMLSPLLGGGGGGTPDTPASPSPSQGAINNAAATGMHATRPGIDNHARLALEEEKKRRMLAYDKSMYLAKLGGAEPSTTLGDARDGKL